jgi:hypothetical protein
MPTCSISANLKIYVKRSANKSLLSLSPRTRMYYPMRRYSDITIVQMLTHLLTHYTTLTADDLETNRDKLALAWNPDRPIKELWLHIKNVKAIASAGGKALTDSSVMRLTLTALERAGTLQQLLPYLLLTTLATRTTGTSCLIALKETVCPSQPQVGSYTCSLAGAAGPRDPGLWRGRHVAVNQSLSVY